MNFSPKSRMPSAKGLPIASLIDVVFLLLIYFIVTSSMVPAESFLSSSLRAESRAGGQAADLQPQIVLVDMVEGEPAFMLGGRTLRTRTQLWAILRQLPKEGGVFVKVTGRVPVSATAAALQACKDAGFRRVSYVPLP